MRAWQGSASDEFARSRTSAGSGSVDCLEKGLMHDAGRQVDEMPREKQSERNVNLNEDFIRSVFLHSKGNVSETARTLGVSRQRLQYYLHKYQLKP